MSKKGKSVILPGSYDPPTKGHLELLRLAAEEYDEVYLVAFVNPNKEYTFTVSQRVAMLMLMAEKFDNVLVSFSSGLVIDYMREHGIDLILKGYRNDKDLEYEKAQAKWNLEHSGYETRLVKTHGDVSLISSTEVRRLLKSSPDEAEKLLTKEVYDYIKETRGEG
jgi:pantetheine-phosphate adenylyltransferase